MEICKRDILIDPVKISLNSFRIQFNWTMLVDLTVILWFCSTPFKSVVYRIASIFGIGDYTQLIAGILTYLPLLVYFIHEKKIKYKIFLTVYIVAALFFLTTYLIHPEYGYWYVRENFGIGYTIFRPDHGALWAIFMVENCETPKRLWSNIKKIALIIFLYDILLSINAANIGYWTYINQYGELSKRSYDLDLGYEMMFVAMVSWVCLTKEKRPLFVVPLVVSVLLALNFGSRGAFLCLIVFGVVCSVFADISNKKRLVLIGCLLLVGAICIAFGQSIVVSVGLFLRDVLWLDSRTVQQMATGSIMDDNGRSGIYSLAISAIQSNPFGYGAYGDRPIVGPSYSWGYSHNFMLELMVNVGVFFAVVILVVFLAIVVRQLLFSRNEYLVYITFIYLAMSARLFVSDTIWGNYYLWSLIGLLLVNASSIRMPVPIRANVFAHIMGSGGTYTTEYYAFISQNFPTSEHVFISRDPSSASFGGVQNGPRVYKTISPRALLELNRCKCIVAHNLINRKVLLLLLLQPWLLKKTNWIVWGGDIYEFETRERPSVADRVFEFVRKLLYPHIGYISIFSDGDYSYAIEHYHVKPIRHYDISYPTLLNMYEVSGASRMDGNRGEGEPVVIQVGNSATATNQHFEALDMLSKFKDENIRIFLPLCYGEDDYQSYACSVIERARQIFGSEKVIAQTDRVDGSTYLGYLNEVQVGVFNNNRQQAMGNISQLMLLGAKIFIRTDTTMWNHFFDLGCQLNPVEQIPSLDFSEFVHEEKAIKERNIAVLNKRNDPTRKTKQWNDVFTTIDADLALPGSKN